MNAPQVFAQMSPDQRERVAQHLGLVGMQVNRMLGSAGRALDPSYRDELFQEGCLGLIRAVQSYDPECGMAFSTYALPRIGSAAQHARRRVCETIRLPERHGRGGSLEPPAAGGASQGRRRRRSRRRTGSDPLGASSLRVHSCASRDLDKLSSTIKDRFGLHGWRGAEPGQGEVTFGELVRRKLEDAAAKAVRLLSASSKGRPDRAVLARTLVDQRLMVPEEGFRATLRQVARDTGSSYGRVAACEALLTGRIKRILDADVEFGYLRRMAAQRREGLNAVVDRGVREGLRSMVSESIMRQFTQVSRALRSEILLEVVERSGERVERVLRRGVDRLEDDDRSWLAARLGEGGAVPAQDSTLVGCGAIAVDGAG
ncbi:MAG: hypothetical protein GY842_21890 [bacterium]|nr:hypothetical protein [bacterium]